MKILALAALYPPSLGGMQYSNFLILKSLAKRGHVIHVIAGKNISDGNVASFEVDNLSVEYTSHLYSGYRHIDLFREVTILNKAYRFFRPDIVLSMGDAHDKCLGLWGRLLPFRTVLIDGGTRINYPGNFFKRYVRDHLLNSAYKRAKKIICISSAGKERLLRLAKIKHKEISVIGRPIAKQMYVHQKEKSVSESKTYPILLTVGRIEAAKGMDTVIKALPKIKEIYPEVQYHLVGEGEYVKELQGLVDKLGLQEIVRFMSSVPHDQLPSIYKQADLYVQVSRYEEERGYGESFGRTVAEAQACGLPVVCRIEGGLSDVVEPRCARLLPDLVTVDDVADAVLTFLGDRTLLQELSCLAQQHVRRFHQDLIAEQYEQVLMTCL